MSNRFGVRFRIWIVAFSLILSACAESPKSGEMVVKPEPIPSLATNKTLKVEDVIGGEETSSINISKLGSEEFHQALVSSLQNSGMFHRITTEDEGDWQLRAMIVSQKLTGAWENVQEIMVKYDLTNAADNSTLWSEVIYSSKEMGASDVFLGAERARIIIEKTAQDNISQLLQKLRGWISENPELETNKS